MFALTFDLDRRFIEGHSTAHTFRHFLIWTVFAGCSTAKMVMINDFCKIMLANKNPRYSLLDNKRIMIQQYWDHSKEIDDAFKRALKINKEYEKMVQHLVDQIKKNQEDATKNEIPEILMRFSPIHILQCRQAHRN